MVNKEILNNPNIYPTPSVKKRLYGYKTVDQDIERVRNRIWTKIKTGT
jgi:putrescine transport system substrate-binding protein